MINSLSNLENDRLISWWDNVASNHASLPAVILNVENVGSQKRAANNLEVDLVAVNASSADLLGQIPFQLDRAIGGGADLEVGHVLGRGQWGEGVSCWAGFGDADLSEKFEL